MSIFQQERDSFGRWIDALFVQEEHGLTNFLTDRFHLLFMPLALLVTVSGRDAFAQVGKMVPYESHAIPQLSGKFAHRGDVLVTGQHLLQALLDALTVEWCELASQRADPASGALGWHRSL
jgi:hypothetical protein